jgi:hypothetical protein
VARRTPKWSLPGSAPPASTAERIDRMMAVIAQDAVLRVDVRTRLATGVPA